MNYPHGVNKKPSNYTSESADVPTSGLFSRSTGSTMPTTPTFNTRHTSKSNCHPSVGTPQSWRRSLHELRELLVVETTPPARGRYPKTENHTSKIVSRQPVVSLPFIQCHSISPAAPVLAPAPLANQMRKPGKDGLLHTLNEFNWDSNMINMGTVWCCSITPSHHALVLNTHTPPWICPVFSLPISAALDGML